MKVMAVFLAVVLASTGSTAWAKEQRPATEDEIALIRAAMQTDLLDADSAKFRDVKHDVGDKGGVTFCGLVNAKNSFGAYTGFKAFAAFFHPQSEGGLQAEKVQYDSDTDHLNEWACGVIFSHPDA